MSAKRNFILAFIVLFGALLLFFAPSFSANQVLFANDGPLGSSMTKAIQPPQSLHGVWTDLNWLGSSGGTFVPNITFFLFWWLKPVGFAKFYGPITLFFLGLSTWLFFRQMRWHPIVCIVGSLAAMLNMNVFSNVCWGLGTRALSLGCIFLALAAFEASKRHKWPWLYLILGGLAVGMSVTEGADNGAIYSLYLAAYVAYSTWQDKIATKGTLIKGVLNVAVIAIFAGVIAAQSIGYLIPTSVTSVAHAQPDQKTKQEGWDWATQWSLPKVEALRVLIPGVFGYRMDTPNGGQYWGKVGEQPGWEEHHQGFPRYSGSGEYAGVIVLLIAAWAFAQAIRGKDGSLTESDRKMVWFWTAAAGISLLLAFGRHAPFYRIIYALPYFSSIRNPIKFMQPFHLSVAILFGYGLQDLVRRLASNPAASRNSMVAQLKAWWAKASGFERKWVYGVGAIFAATILGYLIFTSAQAEVVKHLMSSGFPDATQAQEIARFSSGEVGYFLLFLAGSGAVFLLLQSGALGGTRLKWAGILIALLLVIDLARANAPWVRYYDYKQKYASNPVIDFLAVKPYEHRVATQLMPMGQSYLANNETFPGLMSEWIQHLFQFNNIQSVDIIQMPRMPDFDKAFLEKLRPLNNQDLTPVGRMWQLTDTRYVLGMTDFLPLLNQQVDPVGKRFGVHTAFDVVPKPGITRPQNFEQVTIEVKPDGKMALFEFTGALPRATLFSRWQVSTNDEATLNQLADPAFDPRQKVLVAGDVTPQSSDSGTNQPGSVEYVDYSTKSIKLRAKAEVPSVLLLNDKWDADWRVYVDGAPAKLLRCNYIMRGVAVPAGEHKVEFRYEPALKGLYSTVTGLALALVLCVVVPFIPERKEEQPDRKSHSGRVPVS